MITLHSFRELAHVRSAFEPKADKVNIERLASHAPAAHPIFQPGEDEMPEPVTVDQVENGLLTEYRALSRCAREADQWQLAEVIQDSAKKAAGIVDAIIKTKAAAEARENSRIIAQMRAENGGDNGEQTEPKRRAGRPANPAANGEEKGNPLYPQN